MGGLDYVLRNDNDPFSFSKWRASWTHQTHEGAANGDPLSSYLFILCVEGLSSLMNQVERRGEIHGCRICRRAPSIVHLLFADDSAFFFFFFFVLSSNKNAKHSLPI